MIDLEDSASVHAPQPKVPSIEWDEAQQAAGQEPAPPSTPAAPVARPPAAATPAPLPPEGGPPVNDQQIETLIVEAEVFAKYGLVDKAIERLFSLVRRRPDLLKARERLVELLGESKNPALQREAEALAAAYRDTGSHDLAARVLATAGLGPVEEAMPIAPAPPPPAASGEVEFEEFDIGHTPASPPIASGAPPEDAIDFADTGLTDEPAPFERLATPEPEASADSEFVSYEQLGNLLEDEMQRAGESPQEPSPMPIVDEANLFADEQKFFNLAEELEKELGEEAVTEEPGEISTPQGEVSLEEIFREFKKGVEQQLSAEDYETHYNLGIAYKEMGLVDEAIGEFQLASKDPGRAVECCSMLGHCFLEKGMPQLAIKWFRKGLDVPAIRDAETAGMLYDLASVYQDTGETELAYRTFQEVFGLNANYRDVVQRVRDLEAVRKND